MRIFRKNKYLEYVLFSGLSLILIWIGIIILKAGQIIYGDDAGLLWGAGIITYIGIKGLAIISINLWDAFTGGKE